MKRDDSIILFLFALAVVLALGIGIMAGHLVTSAYKDTEVMDLQTQLETANASLAELNVELSFWRDTMTHLANGEQFKGVDIKYGRPSTGD